MKEFLKIFSCPNCQGEVKMDTQQIKCLNCKEAFSFDEDSVLRLTQENFFFGKDQEKMNKLIKELRNFSSFEELEKNILNLEKISPDFDYQYCLDPRRSDWTFLGDFFDKVVVDLGAGYGSISIPLARRAKLVVAIDNCLERMRFLSQVARLKKLENMISIFGDIRKLPFKENSIDKFLMVGILEYFGREQKNFLKYLFKFLKPGGEVWIGIENRLSPIHFLGRRYHDEEFPFEQLLPEFLRNFFHKIVWRKPPTIKLRTGKGYLKLLKESGFQNINFFYSFPDYKNPAFIVSNNKEKIISKYFKTRSWTKKGLKMKFIVLTLKILDNINLSSLFAPTFFIQAQKGT